MEESYRGKLLSVALFLSTCGVQQYKAKVSVENCRKTPDANAIETGIACYKACAFGHVQGVLKMLLGIF